MIEESVVEEVLARSGIEGVISPYVTLKRAGGMMKGLCPFHSERTPSFCVYPKNNSFFCFGCGVGGDAITFIKRVENMDFEDAVEFLAKRAGITILRTERGETNGPRYDRNRILEMNREAARYFHARLFDQTPGAAAAREYLVERRGLSMGVIKHFGLGYAPYDPRGFQKHFFDLGYKPDELMAGFLLGKSESNGSFYQSFRDRVMYPVIDVSGNVIAFGGRVLDDSVPKYKNSSDTPVFKKSKNLYAMNFARTSCAESLILCEGYMDVIAMHAAGVTNAVATLGTAITPEQARLISHYTKKVILSYDSDEAGQKATARALSLLEQVGLSVQILRIEGAKDPDEYIKKFGVDSFRRLLDGSHTKFEFNLQRVLSKHDVSQPQAKIDAISELCSVISEVYSSAERDVYIGEVAKRLEIDPAGIRSDVNRLIARKKKVERHENIDKLKKEAVGYGDKVNPDRAKDPMLANCEDAVLSLLLLYPEHRTAARRADVALREEDFMTAFGQRVFSYLMDCCDGPTLDVVEMNNRFSEEEIGRITGLKVSRMDLTENGTEAFSEAVDSLRRAMRRYRGMQEGGSSLAALASLIEERRKTSDS
ncbi:MAG: DNA primase [Clostridia bacterium]|nr:DNA primase [Clostridia bacterium]